MDSSEPSTCYFPTLRLVEVNTEFTTESQARE